MYTAWITRGKIVNLLKDWYMGYLDHQLERITGKVAVCNPLKKLLMAPRELRNLISQQLADLPTYIFPTVDFRMAEEDTDNENQEIGETSW